MLVVLNDTVYNMDKYSSIYPDENKKIHFSDYENSIDVWFNSKTERDAEWNRITDMIDNWYK